MDSDGGNKIKLTDNCYRDRLPVFSPDGTKLAISHYQGAPTCDCCNETDVSILNISDSSQTSLFGTAGYDSPSNWTSAGILLREDYPSGSVSLIQPDGTGYVDILDSSRQADRAIFSPDKSELLYRSYVNGDLYVSYADGSNPARITNGLYIERFDWGWVKVRLAVGRR